MQNGLFIEDRIGRLMRLEENELSRYRYELWFEYTRAAMNQVREGAMVAVANFASRGPNRHLSILEITNLKPIHYALGDNPEGYPGFVMEAARNAAQDWTTQEDRSDEDTTIIICSAIPTNLELIIQPGQEPQLAPESNIPMIGADARLLNTPMVERVVNRGITMELPNIAVAGTLLRDANVNVLVRVQDLVKVHFGIFGFTGSGKSNLVSTMITTVFPVLPNSKVVLFDLMGEYGTLLIDRLNTLDNGLIICLGDRSLPQGVFNCINTENPPPTQVSNAARQLIDFFLLPNDLVPHRNLLIRGYETLLRNNKIRIYSELQNARVNDVCDTSTSRNPWRNRRRGTHSEAISRIVRQVFGRYFRNNVPLTPQLAQQLRTQLSELLEDTEYVADFQPALDFLDEISQNTQAAPRSAITRDQIMGILNGEGQSLLVIIAHNPDDLRTFANRIGETAYENRRQTGRIDPPVSFIFDEADEFIPQQAAGSYLDSKEIAETLARRGRKFGLGLGIATQRTRYLDTSIMAQPHTYFVSKLPRKTDREIVAEAFGISEEMLQQTFTFQAGNWLLVSHDATGLKAVPIPISAANANTRLLTYLQTINQQGV